MKRLLHAATLGLAATAWPVAAGPTAPLVMPASLGWEQPLERAQLAAAVVAALTARHWIVESADTTAITARYDESGSWLRVVLALDDRALRYAALDSADFGHDAAAGEPVIHPRANRILRRLDNALRAAVAGLQQAAPALRVVPADPGDPGPAGFSEPKQ